MKAFVRWGRIRRYDRPGAWVRRVAIRDGVRLAERSRRMVGREPVRHAEPEDAAGRVDLQHALADLPPRQRAALVLHYLADWPTAEVANALGCAESTVRVHLHRGRTALAAALQPEESNDGR